MGIYLFNREVLFHLLDNDLADFGRHVIPRAIQSHRVFSYVFQGYWEDIGTIRSFFEANLDLASELPCFNFFDMSAPIYTRPRFLPASKINGASIDHAIIDKNARIGDHCIITPFDKPETVDHPLYYIRDGIVIIPKSQVIPHGTVI
jgi:glucose-1-phosphate adenylyltransferase